MNFELTLLERGQTLLYLVKSLNFTNGSSSPQNGKFGKFPNVWYKTTKTVIKNPKSES